MSERKFTQDQQAAYDALQAAQKAVDAATVQFEVAMGWRKDAAPSGTAVS